MEWNLFLKISQILHLYYETHDDEYKELFQCEWNVYVCISLYYSDIFKKEKETGIDRVEFDLLSKKMYEMTNRMRKVLK